MESSFAAFRWLQSRVAAIEDLRSRGGFSFQRRGSEHAYFAYLYPSPAAGPRCGKQEVHVYHK